MSTNKLIYVVEDDLNIQELLSYNLIKNGYAVECFESAEKMLKKLEQYIPNAILLDIMLPGMDGLDACQTIRSNYTKKIPIIMLTAKDEEADIVSGLEIGADDYMVKPFSPRILMARLKAVLRRSRFKEKDIEEVLETDGINIHPGRHEVHINSKKIDLSSYEFKILYLLANKKGWVYTRNQIVENIHGDNYPVTERSVDVMMTGLRKKLGDYGKYIETVRGIGYRFKGGEDE